MRLSGTKTGSVNQYRGLGNQLWDLAGNRPSLDLPFSDSKSLVDTTTGKTLVDHTRASSGTYVGSDGLIKTATTNLLGYSQDSGQWTVNDSTVTNTTVEAPDNSLTAISLEEHLVTSPHYTRISGFSAATANTEYTMSVYAKAGVRDYITLWADSGRFDSTAKQTFDIANGTLGDSLNVDDKSITSVGNGWYRCSMTFTSGAAPTGTLYCTVLTNDSSDTSNNKVGISGIACYLWGAQLEQSSTVGEYVKTTSTINSAPRFDHDPTTGESLGLLVEESRTNLITNSDLLSDFINSSAGSFSTVTETGPDNGTQVARIVANSSNFRCRIKFPSGGSANNIVVSAFVKKNTHRYVQVGFGGGSNNFAATFDIEPGVTNRLLSQGGDGTYTNIDAGYQDYANGWVRIWAAGTTSGSEGPGVTIVENDTKTSFGNNNAFDGTESIYVWGAQYEDNVSFPTSYIPTEGSTVTRAADVASISGSNFSSWYRQDEGTVFCEFDTANANGVPSGFNTRIFQVSDGTANNRYDLFAASSGTLSTFMNTLSTSQLAGVTIGSAVANNIPVPTCFGYKNNDVIIAGNGALSTADNSCDIPTTSQLNIGSRGDGGVGAVDGHIKRLTYWPARLPDFTLQTITQ